ncbi:related to zinc alcohol dehydrogenase [Fusarium oxysporum]|uniref:Related to zinc alcohol dehydrogenase n=1 Tax=Fusarium oxysporum TaxID=5507 RepID=A0A2H3SKF5_FUSOX|nr:related to zinc alcohol dehydrogenase [Fusarium oxysporum]
MIAEKFAEMSDSEIMIVRIHLFSSYFSTAKVTCPAMFALRYASAKGGVENNLALEQKVDKPVLPGAGPAALVKVLHSSLNPQDYKLPELPFLGPSTIPPPAIPGTDYVGRIHETNIPELEQGDLVFGTLDLPTKYGSLAEYVLIKGTDGIAKLPKGFEESRIDLQLFACLGTAGLTALQSLESQTSGAQVFINGGSGGTGTFCIQIAKNINGAARIVTTCSAKNFALVKELGADEVIDYAQVNVVESLRAVTQLAGRKFDLVVDNVGNSPDLYWQSHSFLHEGGHFIQIGAPNLNLGYAFATARKLMWSRLPWTARAKFSAMVVKTNNEQLETLGRWIAEGKLKAVIGGRYSLGEAAQAFAVLKSGKARGKLVIDVAGYLSLE